MPAINASLFTNTSTFNDGAISPQQIFGVLYPTLPKFETTFIPGFGVLVETAGEEFFLPGYGVVAESGTGFDSDTLFGGLIKTTVQDIEQSILEDIDTFFDGEINFVVTGELAEDIDTFFDGRLQVGSHPFSLINVATVVGLGDIVDLVDEVVLASASGAIIGKHTVHRHEDTA